MQAQAVTAKPLRCFSDALRNPSWAILAVDCLPRPVKSGVMAHGIHLFVLTPSKLI